MRFSLFLFIVSIFQAQAISSYAQKTKLSLEFKNSSVAAILNEIENNSEFYFLCNRKLVDLEREVNIQIIDQPIDKILSEVFRGTDVEYIIKGRQIILTTSLTTKDQEKNTKKVTGKVTDSSGVTLPGVSVVVKGTASGVITDNNGSFSISDIPVNAILQFSFVGMKNQEVVVTDKSVINIILKEETIGIEEVVAVGYGTVKQKDITGSTSVVRAQDFNMGLQLSPQQLIQGKMAGLQISQNSGKPGGSNTVRVRGGTSITASNEPLYVIDGMPISTTSSARQVQLGTSDLKVLFDQEPVNPLNSINPADIEDITVLKDASATAIYGSRGANGVIIITTKRGAAGSIQTSYSASAGFSVVSKKLGVLNATDYLAVCQAEGTTPVNGGSNTNWQDEIFRAGFSQSHDLSISGGNKDSQYRASIGYNTLEGTVIGSNQKAATGRINVNHSALDGKLKLDFRVSAAQISAKLAPISNTPGGQTSTNVLYDAYTFNPTCPVYDTAGNFTQYSQFVVNPVSYSRDIDDEQTTRRLFANIMVSYQIFDPISFKINYGNTYQDINRNSYVHKTSPIGGGIGGFANTQNSVDYSNLLETYFMFDKKIGKHSVNAIAGYSWQYFVEEGSRIGATGFISDAFKWNSMQAAEKIYETPTYKESNTLISFYGRANYNYSDRYLVTATVRRDGSSRFGSGNKWGIFPSGSVAWRVSKGSFFPKNYISDLKLRASYGITGNQEIGNYHSITTLGASTQGYVVGTKRVTVVFPQQYSNPDLQWEETAQYDFGVDFELLNGRFNGRIDYYDKTTSNLLLLFRVPSPSVVSTQLANVGSVQNKGFEFELVSRIIQRGDFTWKNEIIFATNKNNIKSLSNSTWAVDEIFNVQAPGSGMDGVFVQRIKPGFPLGTFYGPEFLGIVNGVETFSAEQKVIGNAQPDFTFGFNNSFMYKNFDLQVRFRGTVGNDVVNGTRFNLSYKGSLPGRNIIETAKDDGLNRQQQKRWSSRWIEDGSYARLDNLTLGYTFNTVKNKIIKNARIYVLGQNLFVITKYSGQDPEVNSDVSGTGVAPLGIDFLAYPKCKSVSVGANITF